MRLSDPAYVALDVTYRCNERCGFCFIPFNPRLRRARREMSLAQWRTLIDSFGGSPRRFYVTGGEPLLRPDIAGIVEHIKKRGHSCLLTTNGLLLGPRLVRRLLECGVDQVAVSLHGDAAVHDLSCGVKGAHDRVVSGIRALTGSPLRRKTSVSIWCTVNRLNHSRLLEHCLHFSGLGADEIAFNHLEFITAAALGRSRRIWRRRRQRMPGLKPSARLAAGIDARELARQVALIRELGRPDVRFYPELSARQIRVWYDPKVLPRRGASCAGQWSSLWISPSGDVLTCQPVAQRVGALSKDGQWRAAYAGPDYAGFRALLTDCGGMTPLCMRCGRAPYQSPPEGP